MKGPWTLLHFPPVGLGRNSPTAKVPGLLEQDLPAAAPGDLADDVPADASRPEEPPSAELAAVEAEPFNELARFGGVALRRRALFCLPSSFISGRLAPNLGDAW